MSGESKSPSALLTASRQSSTGALECARSRPRRSAHSSTARRADRTPHRHHRSDSGRRASDAAINSRPRRSSISMDHRQSTNNAQPILAATSNKAHVNNISNITDGDTQLGRVDFVAPLGERLSATRFSSSSESKLEVAKLLEAEVAGGVDDADVATPRRSSTGALEQAQTMGATSQKLRKHRAHGRRDRNRRASLAAPPIKNISFVRTTNKTNTTPSNIDNNEHVSREESQRLKQQELGQSLSDDNSLTIDAVTTTKYHSSRPHNNEHLNRNGLNSSATDGSTSSFSWWATTFRRNSMSQMSNGVLVDNEVTAPPTFFQHLDSISTATKKIIFDTSRMNSNNATLTKHQVKGMIEALMLYESLSSSIVDGEKRSVAFPLYFCLNQYAECSHITAHCRQSFMMSLANEFVRESEEHALHLCVSLALQAEAYAQDGGYDKALASYERLQSIYEIQLSPQICDFYGTDRAARCHSLAILWYAKTGNVNAALEQSKYVTDSLLPNMERRNLPNLICILYPIWVFLKSLGKAPASKAKELCEQYILDYYTQNVENSLGHQNLPLAVFKPLHVLLILHADEFKHARWRSDLTSVMLWAAEADNGRISSNLLARTMSSLGWSSDTLMAELCLRLSLFAKSEPLKKKLLIKSNRLSSIAKESMTDKHGNVLNPIALEENEKVVKHLKGFEGFKYCQELDPESAHSHTTEIDIEHCFDKYLATRKHSEREGGRRASLASLVSHKSNLSSISGTCISEPKLVEARSRMA